MIRDITFSRTFERQFARLSRDIRELTYRKLDILVSNPHHPSLRVKKVKGTGTIWEMSVTMGYRLTFELDNESLYLRKIGTHDILRKP